MLLTEIAEYIADQLNLSPGRWQASEPYVSARVTMDWQTELKSTQLQVLVVPELNQYNMDNSEGRRGIISIPTVKFVSIQVGKGFSGIDPNNDVAPWNESKVLLDLRERITQFIIQLQIPGMKLVDIEELPVDELDLKNRNFNATCQFGFSKQQCGKGPNLL